MTDKFEIRKRTLLINSISAVIERVLGVAMLVWLAQFLFQALSTQEYYIFQAIAAVIVFMPLVALAVASGVARYVTAAYAEGDHDRIRQILSTTLPLFAATAGIILLVGAALAWQIDQLFDIGAAIEREGKETIPALTPALRERLITDCRWMVMIMVVQAAVRIVALPYLTGLLVRQKFMWMDAIALSTEVLRIAILLSLLFGIEVRVLWLVVAGFPTALLNIGVQTFISRRLVPALRFRRSDIRRELVHPILSMAGWSLVSRATVAARQGAATLLFAGAQHQGAGWAIGAKIEQSVFPSALKPLMTLQPAMTAMHATKQEARFRRYYFRFCRYILWGLLFLGVPLIAHRAAVWSLYIPDRIDSFPFVPAVMMLLYIKSVILFPLPMLAQVSLARARVRDLAVRTVVVDLATVAATAIAIFSGGGAVDVGVAQIIVAVIFGPLVYWTFGLALTDSTMGPFLRRTVVPGLLPTLFTAPVCYATSMWIPADTWLLLGVHFAIAWVVYAAVIVVVCEPNEKQDLKNILGKARRFFPRASAT